MTSDDATCSVCSVSNFLIFSKKKYDLLNENHQIRNTSGIVRTVSVMHLAILGGI